jgi:hypothetical protein
MSHEPSSLDIRKQQRLAAWRQKQQQQQQIASLPPPQNLPLPPPPPIKVSWTAIAVEASKHRKKKTKRSIGSETNSNSLPITKNSNPFEEDDDEDEDDDEKVENRSNKEMNEPVVTGDLQVTLHQPQNISSSEALVDNDTSESSDQNRRRKRSRWDTSGSSLIASATSTTIPSTDNQSSSQNQDENKSDSNETIKQVGSNNVDDTLDQFMAQLHSVAADDAIPKIGDDVIHLSGSVQRPNDTVKAKAGTISNVQSAIPTVSTTSIIATQQASNPIYNPTDWLSDVNPNTDNEEENTDNEDEQRWALINALKQQQPMVVPINDSLNIISVQSESPIEQTPLDDKLSFKEQHEKMVSELEEAAKQVRTIQQSNVEDIGREFFVPEEEGVVEEAIREYEAASQQQADSTFQLLNTVDQTMNKKKELTSHAESIEYEPFQKNIYRVSKSVASLTPTEVTNRRAKLRIRVRGVQVPAPVLQFHEMGLPESVLQYLIQQQNIITPYPIQAQCIPCILAGRDVIGIAKTGSGKTLAYVLPMLRHIIIQRPLGSMISQQVSKSTNHTKNSGSNHNRGETGPIALILVPARELAFQIHSVCKPYGKILGLK